MKLPQLPREIIRREDEPGYEKEIWQPSWNCFCCEDSGIVSTRLAKLVIQGFNPNEDRLPICQAPGCNAGAKWLHLEGNIDLRLTAAICQEFDRISRAEWRQTTEQKFINLKALSNKLAMPGSVERTENENREIQLKKAEIEAITHEEWISTGQKYFNELEEYA